MKKISKLQSSHYRNVPMDSSGTGCRSLGIRKTHFRNQWYNS